MRFSYHDNDLIPTDTKRANVWGAHAAGGLDDIADYCPGDFVSMVWHWRVRMKDDFPACEPDCDIKFLSAVGPTLNCE